MPRRFDYCGDVDGPAPFAAPAGAPAAEVQRLQRSAEDDQRQADVLYLTLLAQSGPITEVTSPKTGDDVSDEYSELFKNNTDRPVRVQVFADFTTPGSGAILSLTAEKGNQGKIDALALVANGRTESVTVILLPTMSLYMREFNTAFPMTVADVLRVRVFDPMKLLSYAKLFSR